MQQERKWIYTLILAICVIVCIILIGKMVLYTDIPQHDPHTVVRRAGDGQAEETREISFDSGALLNLLIGSCLRIVRWTTSRLELQLTVR